MDNRRFSYLHFLMCFTCIILLSCSAGHKPNVQWGIAIHGGAGAIAKNNMSPEKEAAYMLALDEALKIGEKILESGGSALDAVEKTVVYLEDHPLFNAGKGAVFSHEGFNELDVSIMDGQNLNAGAAGSLKKIKNPIKLARKIMENSSHVFLVGQGAEQFAIEQGLDTVSQDWFYTEERWNLLLKTLENEKKQSPTGKLDQGFEASSYGTVGCVALDKNGHLAAGTSTGGMNNKRWNRLGDSPVIGAGTYANDRTCAVSCTGHGEYFIRYAVAHDVHARILYKKESLKVATNEIIHNVLKEAGGEGGLIAIDWEGNIECPFNSAGMYRAWSNGMERKVSIYKD